MGDGLRFEARGEQFHINPQSLVDKGFVPVLVISGELEVVEAFLGNLPTEVSYSAGDGVLQLKPIVVTDEASANLAEGLCRFARSEGHMPVIGFDADDSLLPRFLKEFATSYVKV
jgi:hypothetical protein